MPPPPHKSQIYDSLLCEFYYPTNPFFNTRTGRHDSTGLTSWSRGTVFGKHQKAFTRWLYPEAQNGRGTNSQRTADLWGDDMKTQEGEKEWWLYRWTLCADWEEYRGTPTYRIGRYVHKWCKKKTSLLWLSTRICWYASTQTSYKFYIKMSTENK